MNKEQRQFPRVPESFEASYRPMGRLHDPWREIRTFDLSVGGLRGLVKEPLELSAPLDIQLMLPGSAGQLQVLLRGTVLWSHTAAPGATEVRIRFDDATPDQEMQIDECVQFLLKRPTPRREASE